LESRIKTLAKPVHVVFQRSDESDEKAVCRAKSVNQDEECKLIVVKFIS
jgi:hypothetical protein